MLQNELKVAIDLARLAGVSIRTHYALDLVAEEKISADRSSEPVTEADRAASRIIVEGLQTAFPTDGILSEEETDLHLERLASKRVWIIDPIDGTWGFIKKDGDFAVQIGLAINGEPVLGVVYAPVSDTLYYASAGHGAYALQGDGELRRLRVSDKMEFGDMIIASSRNHRTPKMQRINDHFRFAGETQRGSIGIKVGLISEGEADLYINLSPRSKFWDTCAPQAILEEAGGKLTDIFGAPIRYNILDVQNHNGIVAAGNAAHQRIIEHLRPLLTEFGRPNVKTRALRS